jgi:hypothetical protein
MNAGTETPLPALAGFANDPDAGQPGRTTEQGPVQKFHWKDLYAKRGGLYKYKIVPLSGSFPKLTPMTVATLITNPVQLSPNRGVISSFFNRGILATQSTAKQLTKAGQSANMKGVLLKRIAQPDDPLRKSLAGDLEAALQSLILRAGAHGGACYCALYELTDSELLKSLLSSPFVHVVLSNAGSQDDSDGENRPARTALHEAHVDIEDRFMAKGHIGHNKFVVYVDSQGDPKAVLLGSTNWTPNALCAQTNNALVVESPALAAQYLDYWNRLRRDTVRAKGDSSELQAADFRTANDSQRSVVLEDNSADINLWFSPNTKSKSKGTKEPDDMAEVFNLIKNAKQAVLFLAFYPGKPSIIDAAAQAQAENPDLLVRGALTNPGNAGQFDVDLYHLTGKKNNADRVIPATGVEDQFGIWEKELNQAGFAVIHDKIVVIDPFSENCIVITGSHNLGYRASYANDENLVIIKGHRGLAEAYATHVLDVYDHYRWRFTLKKYGPAKAFKNLDPTDKWQDKYFTNGKLNNPEVQLWLKADPNGQVRRNAIGAGSTRPANPAVAVPQPAATSNTAINLQTDRKRRNQRHKMNKKSSRK